MVDSSASNNAATVDAKEPSVLLDVFSAAQDLPTLPAVVARLMEVIDDPDSSAKDAADLIEQDPAMVVKVLKVFNSALYAPTVCREIFSLQLVISRLGFVAVANIALSTSVFEAFTLAKKPVFDRRQFWRHSVCVGIVASILQQTLNQDSPPRFTRESVHLAGIVHDMGKILFEQYTNETFHQALKQARKKKTSSLAQESALIGLGHDEAGYWLARRWKLGDQIAAVVRWHHDPLSCPDQNLQELAKLIHVADYICHKLQLGQSGNPHPACDPRVLEHLNVTPKRIIEMKQAIKAETEKSQVFFSLAT